MLDLDRDTNRQACAAHHARCGACAMLHAYAEERADPGALAAWRRLVAEHLETERAQRTLSEDYGRVSAALLALGSRAWLVRARPAAIGNVTVKVEARPT